MSGTLARAPFRCLLSGASANGSPDGDACVMVIMPHGETHDLVDKWFDDMILLPETVRPRLSW